MEEIYQLQEGNCFQEPLALTYNFATDLSHKVEKVT